MISIFEHITMSPFLYQPKKKEFEPQPLHIEVYLPTPLPKKEVEEKEERRIIVIEL